MCTLRLTAGLTTPSSLQLEIILHGHVCISLKKIRLNSKQGRAGYTRYPGMMLQHALKEGKNDAAVWYPIPNTILVDQQPYIFHYTADSGKPASTESQGAHATAAITPSLHNLGQTHTRPSASLSNRISYRAVMCVSISWSRPVITTHGSVSNRINSQTPVGGPTQLSGVL